MAESKSTGTESLGTLGRSIQCSWGDRGQMPISQGFCTPCNDGSRQAAEGNVMKKSIALLAGVFAVLLAAQAYAQEINRLSAQFRSFNGGETFSSTAASGSASVPGTGGSLVYFKTVYVPYLNTPTNILYVTISAIGDNHGGESNMLSCNVDAPGGLPTAPSQLCNPTPTTTGIDGAPPGWLTLTHHFAYETTYGSNGLTGQSFGDGGGGTSDEHDNDYYYTWCKPIQPGIHTIYLRQGNHSGASTAVPGGTTVFFEKAFFYIDVSQTPVLGACSAG